MIRAYLAVSVDGYIADAQGGVGWLDGFSGEGLGYTEFVASISTIVSGRATYDQVLGFGAWPYEEKDFIVVSSRPLEQAPPGVRLHSGPVSALKGAFPVDGDVWVLGGGKLVKSMLEDQLIDRFELYVMPVLLGKGVPLFLPEFDFQQLDLVSSTAHPQGVVELIYDVRR